MVVYIGEPENLSVHEISVPFISNYNVELGPGPSDRYIWSLTWQGELATTAIAWIDNDCRSDEAHIEMYNIRENIQQCTESTYTCSALEKLVDIYGLWGKTTKTCHAPYLLREASRDPGGEWAVGNFGVMQIASVVVPYDHPLAHTSS